MTKKKAETIEAPESEATSANAEVGSAAPEVEAAPEEKTPSAARLEIMQMRKEPPGPDTRARVLGNGKTYFFRRLAFAEIFMIAVKSHVASENPSFGTVLNQRFAALLHEGVVESEAEESAPLCEVEEWREFVAQPGAMELTRELVENVVEFNPDLISIVWGSLTAEVNAT